MDSRVVIAARKTIYKIKKVHTIMATHMSLMFAVRGS